MVEIINGLIRGIVIACTAVTFNIATATADELKPIAIDITTSLGDAQTFREGDLISFLLTLERDAWITAVYIDAEQHRLQLIPNATESSSFYKADLFIPIPPADAPYRFRVQPPFGTETLWVFASDTGPVRLPGRILDNGLILLDENIDSIRKRIRSASKEWFGEAKVSIETRAR